MVAKTNYEQIETHTHNNQHGNLLMYPVSRDSELKHIEQRVIHFANEFGRTLPEMRFFVLDSNEFISLLEKRVYPVSPTNVWEGKNVVKRKHEISSGQSSAIYYEVVQTGNPSYAYLNNTNSPTTQASVISHVIGHCEFSELNVMRDTDRDRTERIIYLSKKAERSLTNMGYRKYSSYWNCCESMRPLTYPNSQFNLENSVESTQMSIYSDKHLDILETEEKENTCFVPYSSTLDSYLFDYQNPDKLIKKDELVKDKKESIDRTGFFLKAPCQDIFGFLTKYAPASHSERNIMEYLYNISKNQDFVLKTQIMNEGWAMYWEKKIMTELFKERTVSDIIDYSYKFSGVCYPRPWFQRNPYHLGYNLWNHIENLYKKGKVSVDYVEEKDREEKENWNKNGSDEPLKKMEHLVSSITDYEFIRRFLTKDLIEKFHLNKIPIKLASSIDKFIYKYDNNFAWVDQEFVKKQMLSFFTECGRPLIYLIDADFRDGGFLLFHNHRGTDLKNSYLAPTLYNLTKIWKGPVYVISNNAIYHGERAKKGRMILHKQEIAKIEFKSIVEKMSKGQKPFNI